MRLDKFISQQLEISRAIAGREIRARNVTVDGEVVREAAFKVLPEHEVAYDGNVLHQQHGPRYYMLHKPVGYVCATEDEQHPTILYFIEEPMAWKLHAAGRLDIDTTGLVLLTDDGQWSHRITSPRHHCEKTYRVSLAETVDPTLIARFAAGIMLQGETELTKPAVLTIIGDKEARVTLSEGRYHQVKRMFAACGNHVEALHRESVGDITLDESLEPGEYRALTEAEILSINLPAELQKPLL
ncbi:16S rRNA pseudouridine(516) synthase RsuA [Rosenbergiella australiborealis]|uniref:16S rRNA pseudouridine(516) synthase RsuA n=1 Tax=Rosenbergiella australiborealis TaxID=1544696 RepID=UPI001F4E9E91|nr:16S rRNA pseudouridine(516) synthase RsuA [Rosenbergiella australiborealis]